jgi:hypothetical protein
MNKSAGLSLRDSASGPRALPRRSLAAVCRRTEGNRCERRTGGTPRWPARRTPAPPRGPSSLHRFLRDGVERPIRPLSANGRSTASLRTGPIASRNFTGGNRPTMPRPPGCDHRGQLCTSDPGHTRLQRRNIQTKHLRQIHALFVSAELSGCTHSRPNCPRQTVQVAWMHPRGTGWRRTPLTPAQKDLTAPFARRSRAVDTHGSPGVPFERTPVIAQEPLGHNRFHATVSAKACYP